MSQEDPLTTVSDRLSYALAGYALACACIALVNPSLLLLSAGVLLPVATAIALSFA